MRHDYHHAARVPYSSWPCSAGPPPPAPRLATRDTLCVADPGVIVIFFRHFSPPQSQRGGLLFARLWTFTPVCCRFCTPTASVFSGTSTFPTRPTRKCGRRVFLLACRRRTNPRSRAAILVPDRPRLQQKTSTIVIVRRDSYRLPVFFRREVPVARKS